MCKGKLEFKFENNYMIYITSIAIFQSRSIFFIQLFFWFPDIRLLSFDKTDFQTRDELKSISLEKLTEPAVDVKFSHVSCKIINVLTCIS